MLPLSIIDRRAGADGLPTGAPAPEPAVPADAAAGAAPSARAGADPIGTVAPPAPDPLVVARDACYAAPGYRGFEFASFRVGAGEVCCLLAGSHAPARDLALAAAGLVRPTSGSLAVCGVELAAPAPAGGLRALFRPPAARLPRGVAGAGVFTGLLDVDVALSVEEAVRRELRLRGAATDGVLDYLAEHRLATFADLIIGQLAAPARARLSAALACAGGVRVAALDLDDPFIGGLPASDAAALVRELRAFASAHGACVVAATQEIAAARAADAACALDVGSAEALRAPGAPAGPVAAEPPAVPAGQRVRLASHDKEADRL